MKDGAFAGTTTYQIPVTSDESQLFEVTGHVYEAALYANGALLSILYPMGELHPSHWEEDALLKVLDTEPTQQPLDFLSAPFHFGLVNYPVMVQLVCMGPTPTLTTRSVDKSPSWTDDTTYNEEVMTHSTTGAKKLIMVYHRNGCGFMPLNDTIK
jgi:hypothetical protein